jgi:hypothetical protein
MLPFGIWENRDKKLTEFREVEFPLISVICRFSEVRNLAMCLKIIQTGDK